VPERGHRTGRREAAFLGTDLAENVLVREASIDRRRAHTVLRSDLRDRQFASVHKRAYRPPLAISELARPAAVASTRTGGC
jgi:hypothetical protein